MFKTYQMNVDGTNIAAVTTLTKKDALAKLGVSRYVFDDYGHFTYNELPSFGEVYYKPITVMGPATDKYPWRALRYRLRHDDQGRPFYE